MALIGFLLNPYGSILGSIRSFSTETDYKVMIFQIASWLAFAGGLFVLFYKSDRQQKILGIIAAGIPTAIFIYRYWFLVLCFLPGVSEGCL